MDEIEQRLALSGKRNRPRVQELRARSGMQVHVINKVRGCRRGRCAGFGCCPWFGAGECCCGVGCECPGVSWLQGEQHSCHRAAQGCMHFKVRCPGMSGQPERAIRTAVLALQGRASMNKFVAAPELRAAHGDDIAPFNPPGGWLGAVEVGGWVWGGGPEGCSALAENGWIG